MAIEQAFPSITKVNMLSGKLNLAAGTPLQFFIALYTAAADLGPTTVTYTSNGEVVGTGYTAQGLQLTVSQVPVLDGTFAVASFNNAIWPNSVITARGALIYSFDGVLREAVAVLDFGQNVESSGGNFEVRFPAADRNNAIIRVGP